MLNKTLQKFWSENAFVSMMSMFSFSEDFKMRLLSNLDVLGGWSFIREPQLDIYRIFLVQNWFFKSIFEASQPLTMSRWGLMTLTTVGYDLNPETLLGKIIGGCCALSGVFILTLPIPIVVNSFATYYKNRWVGEITIGKVWWCIKFDSWEKFCFAVFARY